MRVDQKVPSQQKQVTRPMFFRPLSKSTPEQHAMAGCICLVSRIRRSASNLWVYNVERGLQLLGQPHQLRALTCTFLDGGTL